MHACRDAHCETIVDSSWPTDMVTFGVGHSTAQRLATVVGEPRGVLWVVVHVGQMEDAIGRSSRLQVVHAG